jgi:hypothetical protein
VRFLKALLMDLLKQAPAELRPLSPVELDGVELRDVEVRREWKNIDLLIASRAPPFVVAVENKIGAGAYNPFNAYESAVRREFPQHPAAFVLLAPDPLEPPNPRWTTYCYQGIHRVLSRCLAHHRAVIGQDVRVFLEHYLDLIGRRFMKDLELDRLCRAIYCGHRRAIELILERGQTVGTTWINAVRAAIAEQQADWAYLGHDKESVGCMPKSWLDVLPAVGKLDDYGEGVEPRAWLSVWFCLWRRRSIVPLLYLGPVKEDATELRDRVLEAMRAQGKTWGLSNKAFDKTKDWIYLTPWRPMIQLETGEADEDEPIRVATREALQRFSESLAGLPEALRPLFRQQRSTKSSGST